MIKKEKPHRQNATSRRQNKMPKSSAKIPAKAKAGEAKMSAKIWAPMKVAATKAPEGAKLDRALMKGAKNPPPNIKLKGDLVSAAVMHAFTKLSDEKTFSERLVTVYEQVRHVVKEMEGICKEVEDEYQVL